MLAPLPDLLPASSRVLRDGAERMTTAEELVVGDVLLLAEGDRISAGPGTVARVELLTRDPRAAEPFYAEVLGWKAETDLESPMPYTMYKLDGDQVAGMMVMPEEVPAEVPAYWSVYFAVKDVEAAVARTIELGGNVIAPTTNVGGGRFAVLEDPQGAVFSLLERPVAA